MMDSHGTWLTPIHHYRNYYFYPNETELTSAPSFVGILKGDEQLQCRYRRILYAEVGWTVVRCFNQEGKNR